MSGKTPRATRELKQLWARWISVMSKAASNSRRVKKLSSHEYSELYTSLLAAAEKALDEGRDERQTYQLVQKMQAECRPWVSLEALVRAEKNILLETLNRSLQMQKQLSGSHAGDRRLAVRVSVMLGVIAGAYLLFSYTQTNPAVSSGQTMYGEWRAYFYRTWYAAQHTSSVPWMATAMFIVVAFGCWMLRSTKNY